MLAICENFKNNFLECQGSVTMLSQKHEVGWVRCNAKTQHCTPSVSIDFDIKTHSDM